ncbi:MAG: NAD(P)H-binding protein [Actinobacteria bacterium]|nr:NAD(P)H-binding protein [Actinomycetota bacterium]
MTVVVIGAAGDLGRRVVHFVGERGADVRPFTRSDGYDLGDVASLDAAFAGATAVFLQSSPSPDQVALETNAIAAAERAGVARVVKLSNIPVAGLDDGLHGNHRAVERRLAASPLVASTILQPSFFTTVVDRQADLVARGQVVLPFGGGRLAWVDPDDIAEVAAVALMGDIADADDFDRPLVITGPEALDGDEVAARLGVTRLDPPLDQWRAMVAESGMDPWLLDSTVHLFEAVARGALDVVSPDVELVLGRPPRRAFAPS